MLRTRKRGASNVEDGPGGMWAPATRAPRAHGQTPTWTHGHASTTAAQRNIAHKTGKRAHKNAGTTRAQAHGHTTQAQSTHLLGSTRFRALRFKVVVPVCRSLISPFQKESRDRPRPHHHHPPPPKKKEKEANKQTARFCKFHVGFALHKPESCPDART